MKIILYVFSIIGILSMPSCKKKEPMPNNTFGGKMIFHFNYSNSKQAVKPLGVDYHQGLGDYITSITPTVFKGKFLDMRIQSWTRGANMWNDNLNIIDNNTAIDSSNRIADFTNNGIVQFVPKIDGQPSSADIVYNVFVFISLFYYQEFELPAPYDTINNLPMLNFGGGSLDFKSFSMGGIRDGRIIKGSSTPFLAPLFDPNWKGFNGSFPKIPSCFVFGETDSAFTFNGTQHTLTIDNPIGQEGQIMRSPFYDPIVLKPVPLDSTRAINGTMSFDIDGLIQIYAGKDNKPYTQDDVFVYAPKYWNRIKVALN